jgi:glycosyltransferase involved in cell wall biosynthesis
VNLDLEGRRGLGALRLARLLQRHRPNILHCHNIIGHRYGAFCAQFFSKPPGGFAPFLTLHGPQPFPAGARGVINRWLMRNTQIVAVSEEMRGTTQTWLGNGRRVHRIANGISLAPYENLPSRREARAELGWPESAFVVGIVARLDFGKGHLALLEIFARLRMQIPNALLAIVGDGSQRAAIEQSVRSLELEQSVFLLGDRQDVPRILAGLDVFCLPSEAEGLPLSLLEAMAAALPVVVTAVGAIPTVVDNGQSGWLVPPHASAATERALLAVARDPERAAAMGQAARRRVEESFSSEIMLKSYEDLYAQSLAPGVSAFQPA